MLIVTEMAPAVHFGDTITSRGGTNRSAREFMRYVGVISCHKTI